MASTADGAFHYTFCSSIGDTNPGKHTNTADKQCPFAQSASATPLPMAHTYAQTTFTQHPILADLKAHTFALSGSIRTDRSRAPPFSLV
jgi:hypothetical protein